MSDDAGQRRVREPAKVRESTKVREPTIVIYNDADALALAGADWITHALDDAVRERGVAHFAVSGGSSPVATYRVLADRHDIPWAAVHLWWVDDRLVPPDHPESNTALVLDTLLRVDLDTVHGAAIPAAQVHPFPILAGLQGGHGPDWIASTYAEEILRHVPAADGRPRFDVMVLGVGPDGHTMSVFPGSPALALDAPLVLAVPAPEHVGPHLARVTLRAHVADDARALLALVPDGAKSRIVARVLGGERDEAALPAQVARRAEAFWLLTRAAAALLPPQPIR
jgi:6-phosphogluconolactonase